MFKKKSTKILLGILTVLVLILGGIEAYTFLGSKNNKEEIVVQTKQLGPYIVNANQSDYQKEIEPTLLSAISSNSGKHIVDNVSKYFISEFFTLKGKANFNDVGGMGFVFPEASARFKVNAVDSYYRDLDAYKQSYGKDNLPVVTEVTTLSPRKAKLADIKEEKEATLKVSMVYDIDVEWKYEENEKLKDANLVDKVTLRYVKASDGNWYLYELIGLK